MNLTRGAFLRGAMAGLAAMVAKPDAVSATEAAVETTAPKQGATGMIFHSTNRLLPGEYRDCAFLKAFLEWREDSVYVFRNCCFLECYFEGVHHMTDCKVVGSHLALSPGSTVHRTRFVESAARALGLELGKGEEAVVGPNGPVTVA